MYNLGVIFILYELADATIYSKLNMSKVKKGSLNANDWKLCIGNVLQSKFYVNCNVTIIA